MSGSRGAVGLLLVSCALLLTAAPARSPESRVRRRARRRIWPLLTSLSQHVAPAPDGRDLLRDVAGLPDDKALFGGLSRQSDLDEAFARLPAAVDPRRLLAGVPEPVIVEVGAFVGEEMALYARALRPKRLVAVEPGPYKVDMLRSLKEELEAGLGKGVIELVEAAASDRDGMGELFLPNSQAGVDWHMESQQDSLFNSSFWADSQPGVEQGQVPVRLVRLDSLLDEPIDYLEVDAQGADFAVLRGAEGLIREHGIDIIRVEFTPKGLRLAGEDPVEMLHWLADRHYTCFDVPVLADTMERVVEPWTIHKALKDRGKSAHGAPVGFDDYVGNLEGMTWVHESGADVGHWRDLLCFQAP